MRLGQLARKLDKKPQELVDFLENEHQLKLDTDLNTKVEGELLEILTSTFKNDEQPLKEVVAEKVAEAEEEPIADTLGEANTEVESEIELTAEEIEEMATKAVASEIEEGLTEETGLPANETEEEELMDEKIERIGEDGEVLPELVIEDGVIKAPKLQLDGPKVVGKIDLPTIKRGIQFLVTNSGETTDVTEEIYEKKRVEKEASKKRAIEERKERKNKQQKKRARRTITDADRKAHEERRRQRKNAEQKEKQAKKRKQHYRENVQKKVAVKSQKKKQKEIEKAVKKQKAPKLAAPTTLWGKFKRWLNT